MIKKRRAAYIAAGLGILLLAPVFYLKALDGEGDPFARDLGQVPNFLTTDTAGLAMSRFDLNGNLTFVAWLIDVCQDPQSLGCERASSQLRALSNWIGESLLYRDQDEQTPVRLVAVAPQQINVPPTWRKLEVTGEGSGEARALLPTSCAEVKAPLIVIDQTEHARRCFPLAEAQSWAELKPLLSRMTINHYMHDYLTKRTFFRRTPKLDQVEGEGATH